MITAPNSNLIVSCNFLNQTLASQKTCEISIANGLNCQGSLKGRKNVAAISGNTVVVNINDLFSEADKNKMYCYNITASDGNKRVVIQGIIPAGNFAIPIMANVAITITFIAITVVIITV